MNITISSNDGTTFIGNVEQNESACYKAIAECISKGSIPNVVRVWTELGDAKFNVIKRGTYVKNGVTYPSMHVVEEYNGIRLPEGTYPETYLTCVNPESNNYKHYKMTPLSDGIHVKYGRIGQQAGEMFGEREVQTPYPSRMFWMLYYEKLSKGYIDQSDVFLASATQKDVKKAKAPENERAVSIELYKQLRKYAKQVVEEHLVTSTITEAQVKKAKAIFKELCSRKTVNGFNKQLLLLLSVSPRKARDVSVLLAKKKDDFAHIIIREENLISAMEALAGPVLEVSTTGYSFKGMGISVFEATPEQREKVLGKLSDNLKGKVKKVYRVINREHQERFNKYLKKQGIKHVKELWHGSKNENWLSIVQNGLQLYPNAQITGKMFGNGIYFAASSEKSWNYTSFHGTYWAKGSSDTAFMGLYATAYGKPLDVTCAGRYTQSSVLGQGKNCVHAHAGTQLRNDEIIFYAEEAMLLNYIVEFAA